MDAESVQRLIEQALAALHNGESVRAVALADQAIAAEPDHPLARAIRAQVLLEADDPAEAYQEAQRAVQLSPRDPYARLLLGQAAWRKRHLAAAQQQLREAVNLSRRDPKFLAEYAWFMASERGPKPAETAATDAVEADERCSTAWAALGLVQHRQHRWAEAEESLRRALVLNPADIYAQSAMAQLLQEKREDEKAVALAELLEQAPGAAEFVEAVRKEAKQRQIQRMLLERNVDLTPRQPVSSRQRGAWLLALGVMTAGVLLLIDRTNPVTLLACVIVPFVFLWYLRVWLQ